MASNQLAPAVSTVTGEQRDVPAHWLGERSPFPGQWKPAEEAQQAASPAPSAPKPTPTPTPTPSGRQKPSSDRQNDDKSEED